MQESSKTKILFAAIAGHTNAGKSSLLNALIGEKIASVSPKPQTTRTRITGIRNVEETQLVFTDTPGLHRAQTKLGSQMLKAAREAVSEIDCVIFMQDCTKPFGEQEQTMLDNLTQQGTPVLLVYNKIDLLKDKTALAPLLASAESRWHPAAIIPVSVTQRDGLDDLMQELLSRAVEGPHYFPEDMLTDQPERVLCAELIREKALRHLRDEVPHGIGVEILKMESHKRMIIGKKGAMLKRVGERARKELEQFFRIQVHLQTWVKVKEDWRNRDMMIEQFGLKFDQ